MHLTNLKRKCVQLNLMKANETDQVTLWKIDSKYMKIYT